MSKRPQVTLYDYEGSICSQMARLALVEKGVDFVRREVDIMEANEQFEPWYVAMNPNAVVPTLQIGDVIVTNTIRIVNRAQEMDGPDLSGDDTAGQWLRDIMDLHYGVLLYRNRLDPDGTAPQIVARGRLLERMRGERPDLADLIERRLAGNRRLQQLLRDPDAINCHLDAARGLVDRMAAAAARTEYLAGNRYSLADCFATAALARFRIHGFEDWWAATPLSDYYRRVKARPSFAMAAVVDTGTERDL